MIDQLTVGELKEKIQYLPDDTKVFIQSTPDGGFFPGFGVDTDVFAETSPTGKVGLYTDSLGPEELGVDEEEWERIRTLPKAIVIWPTMTIDFNDN